MPDTYSRVMIRVRTPEKLALLLQHLIRTGCPFVYMGLDASVVLHREDWEARTPESTMFRVFEHIPSDAFEVQTLTNARLDMLAISGMHRQVELLGALEGVSGEFADASE